MIVLVLNTIPCCALENNKEQAMEQSAKKNAIQHGDDCKNCSPFYSCRSCFGSVLVSTMVLTVDLTEPQVRSITQKVIFNYTDGVEVNVWQPPKAE